MDEETAGKMRGMARLVTLCNLNDDGEQQTATIEIADGHMRDEVEILQPFGFASHVPEDGALGLAFQVSGAGDHWVVLPVGNPSMRMGGLKSGEVGLYNEHGDKLVLQAGGDAMLKTGGTLNIEAKAMVGKIDQVTFEGASLKHNNKEVGDTHTHGGTMPGGGSTDVPD